LTEERRKRLITLRDDLIEFGQTIAPKFFSVQSPSFHYEIAEPLLDDSVKFLNVIAPRGTAKSTLAILKALHHLMFTKGKKVVAIVSRTQGHAINLLQTIKDIVEYSPEFRELFGYWGINTSEKWTSTEIRLKDGSAIVCRGMGMMFRGINIGGQRPTLIILDDPEDENNTKTSEAMDANLTWLLQSAEPAVDAEKGRIVVIGTPLHQNCIVMKLKESKKYKTLHYKYLHDEDGVKWSLWPKMFSVAQLEQMKKDAEEMGKLSSFYKERQCEVIGDEDQLFKPEYMQSWDGYLEVKKDQGLYECVLHITEQNGYVFPREKVIPVNTFLGVDPASSVLQTADFSVVFPVAYDKDENIYCLPYWRKRATPMDVAEGIFQKIEEVRPQRGGIETTGYQEMLREYVRKGMIDRKLYLAGFEATEGYKPRTEKSKRLERLHPFFYRRKVWIKKGQQTFLDELFMFPRGRHDDLLDGFDYATKRLYPPTHTTETKKKTGLQRPEAEKSWYAHALG